VGKLDRRFLSVSIDAALLVGERWWVGRKRSIGAFGTARVEPLDFDQPELIRAARCLVPAYLRIGGSESDRIRYQGSVDREDRGHPQQHRRRFGAHFSRPRMRELGDFMRATGLDLFFTVNAGPGMRDASGAWRPAPTARFLEAAAEANLRFAVLELGNEVNGFPVIHGPQHRVSPRRYARDFARFAALARDACPQALLAGPASAVWPIIGEPFPLLPGFVRHCPSLPELLTWHFYPQQSRRGVAATRRLRRRRMLDPHVLNSASRHARHTRRIVRTRLRKRGINDTQRGPSPAIWLGETGHALYGGEPGVSNRFGASLWWADHLGAMAQAGMKGMIRQSLVGADYGLIDAESLAPNPDFWVTVLWKLLVGPSVYAVDARSSNASEGVRFYLHDIPGRPRGRTAICINTLRETGVRLDPRGLAPPQASDPARSYLLTASSRFSRRVRLNDRQLNPAALDDVLNGTFLRVYGVEAGRHPEVPPQSILFLTME
jgi:heparanase 1